MPPAVKFFVRHSAIGMLIGALVAAILYLSNVGGLGDLLDRSQDRTLLLALLVFLLGSTLSAVQIAIALLLQDDA